VIFPDFVEKLLVLKISPSSMFKLNED